MTSCPLAAVQMPENGAKAPLISVIIPTLNREELLVATIRYFLEHETYQPFELIVVDQSDLHEPETVRYLESVASRIRLEHPAFKSLTKARNYGLGIAKGEIVVFVDDDVEPYEGFLSGHAAPYADPKVWMVTGPSPKPGGELISRDQMSERQYRALLDGQLIGLSVDFDYEPCSWGEGCNISMRKEAAARVGGFDETFAIVGDDAEFCHRIRRHGGVIHYAVRAGLVHLAAVSGGTRSARGPAYVRTYARDQNYFFRAVSGSPRDWLRANWTSYRRLVLNRYSLGRLPALHWAFAAGVLSGLRRPLSKFSRP